MSPLPATACAQAHVAPPAPGRPVPARGAPGLTPHPRLVVVPAEVDQPPPQPAQRERAAALYRRLGPVVYRRCLGLLHDPEQARDATQEVFLRLVRSEPRLLGRDDLAPWLFRVASNHCLNLRREARHHGEEPLDGVAEPAAPPRGDPVDALLVRRLLAQFDLVTQAIAVAVLVEEQEHEDVAAALGLSRRTMARKLERFVELARRQLVLGGEAPVAAGAR